MAELFWVCVGGAVGSGTRYVVSLWAVARLGTGFAWGTLLVNVVGSFALALLMHLAAHSSWVGPTTRIALGIGVLGGFTTYSTFNYETLEYLRAGSWALAGANAAATMVGCLGASVLGLASARWIAGA
jgi:CrcB protein